MRLILFVLLAIGLQITPVFADDLQLCGSGVREKFFIDVYRASLYLEDCQAGADQVVAQPLTTRMDIEITSSLLSSKKMEKAIRKGFKRSLGTIDAGMQSRIEQFISVFKRKLKVGDLFRIDYLQGRETTVEYKGNQLAAIEGDDFRSALFGIWLGKDPVSKNLKSDLLP